MTTTIKKSGGSLIITVPAKARDALNLSEGQEMNVAVEDGRLVYEVKKPAERRRSRYSLTELLAQCDPKAPVSEADENWLNRKPVGRELW